MYKKLRNLQKHRFSNKLAYYEKKEDKIQCNYNVLLNKIVVSNGFLKKLNEQEVNFLINHEAGHMKDRGIYFLIYITIFINICSLVPIFLTNIFIRFNFEIILLITLLEILFIIITICFYRILEYRADLYAANKIPYVYFVSAMDKFKNEKYPLLFKVYGKLTHPTIANRISRFKEINQGKNE